MQLSLNKCLRLLQRNTDEVRRDIPALYPGCNARVLRVFRDPTSPRREASLYDLAPGA